MLKKYLLLFTLTAFVLFHLIKYDLIDELEVASASSSIGSTRVCPQLMPSYPDACKGGKIIPRGLDEKGCQLPSLCEKNIPEGVLVTEGDIEIKTALPVKLGSEGITVSIADSEKIIVPPSTAIQSVEEDIKNIQLIDCSTNSNSKINCVSQAPVYQIDVSKNTKFINIIPLKINYSYLVDALTGDTISDTKPWFFRNFDFLFITPNKTQTSDWKTISNKKVGVTFEYPANLLPYINEPQIPNLTYFGFDAFSSEEKRDHRTLTEADLELELTVYKPAIGSIEPYLSAIQAVDNTTVNQPFPGNIGSYTKVKTITRGVTQTAILYAEPVGEFSEYSAIILDGSNNVAIIRLMTGSHEKRQQLLPVLEQISSSFRFTE